VESPQLVRQIRPAYTAEAMRAKVQGVVVVQCVVMQDGTVGEAPCHQVARFRLRAGSGSHQGRPAVEIHSWPPIRPAVNVQISIELTFTLR